MDFPTLSHECAPAVAVITMQSLVLKESAFNPFAIGVIGGSLVRQPRHIGEAIATARYLDAKGYNYDLGIAQINKKNFTPYHLTIEQAFDPCRNLNVGSEILRTCYFSARKKFGNEQQALGAALSCYNTGNFRDGYSNGYVKQVFLNASKMAIPFAKVSAGIRNK